MASVFLASDLVLHREVAIKVPRRSVLERPELADRFRQEARSLARVKHPHLAAIYDTGESNGLPYVVMEFVSGVTLAEYLQEHSLTVAESVAVVRDVALALQAAHAVGIVHRDLKPENVMLTTGRQPKVIDFGLAKNTAPDGPRPTRVGTVMGTPHYLPLEQLRGEVDAIRPASDVYSLGVVLYRLLAGRLPYPGHELEELLANLMTRTPPSPCEFQPDLDPKLAAIVLKAIARDREDRYPSMQEFADALAGWLRLSTNGDDLRAGVADARLSPPTRRRKATIAAATAVGMVLLGVIVISLKRPDGTQSTITISSGTNVNLQTVPGTEVSVTELPDADDKAVLKADAVPRPAMSAGSSDTPEPVATGDPVAIQKLKDTLLNYEWHYADSKYLPGDSCRFYENGEFHKWKWNYWVVGPRTVHIQYGDPVYKPESAIVFSVNEDLSEVKGSFGEGKNQITITRLKPVQPEVAADSSEPRLFNGDWKIENGELVLSSERVSYGHWWTFGELEWSDFDLKVEMSYHELCPSCALIVRHTSTSSGWHVRLGPWGEKNFDLVCFAPGENAWHGPTRRWLPGRLHGKSDVWQTVEVRARGEEISVSIGGEFITRSRHPGVVNGLIGFHTYGPGTVRWRNLELRRLDGKVLQSGFPEVPGVD